MNATKVLCCPFCGEAPALVYHGFTQKYERYNTYYWVLEDNLTNTIDGIIDDAKQYIKTVDSKHFIQTGGGGTPWWTVSCKNSVGDMRSHSLQGCPLYVSMPANKCFSTPEEAIALWNVRYDEEHPVIKVSIDWEAGNVNKKFLTCGHEIDPINKPNFCPTCGAKVVSE